MKLARYPSGTQLINRYEVLDTAFGGMGEVIFCRDLKSSDNEMIVLKTFFDEFLDTPEAVASFVREAEGWMHLGVTRSAGMFCPLVGFRGVLHIDEKPYISMDFCSGGSLRQRLSSNQISPTELANIATQLLIGIEKMSSARLIHRDLKPENILFDEKGDIKIGDFGISKVFHERTVAEIKSSKKTLEDTSASGTLPYMAPEQLAAYGSMDSAVENILALIAQAFYLLGYIDKAKDWSTALVEENPENISAWNSLLQAVKAFGEAEEARRVVSQAIEANGQSDDPLKLYMCAAMSANVRDWETTINFADRTLEKVPTNLGAFHLRCISLFNLGRKEDARDDYFAMKNLAPLASETVNLAKLFEER